MSVSLNSLNSHYYQGKLNELRVLNKRSSLSYNSQHDFPSGSESRDRLGRNTNQIWDQEENLLKELRAAGVLSRNKITLTPLAKNLGLHL